MSDLERLTERFANGTFVRPGAHAAGFVDLVRAIATTCGVPALELNEHSHAIGNRLRRADHIVFLLADGLGVNFIDTLPRDAWLRRHTQRTIHAPYPSTTTAAVATLATGAHPAAHGIIGWWTHLPAINAPVTVFTTQRVEDEVSITTLGLTVRDLSPLDPIIPRMTRDVAVVQPHAIVDSDFTRYLAGDAPRIGYRVHAEAAELIAQRIAAARGPTYTYWYTSIPDSLSHELGTGDAHVAAGLADLDRAVAGLDQQLAQLDISYRILATADHGHLDVGGAGHLEVAIEDPLMQHLTCPPSGDVRTQFWHVREGEHATFEHAFRERFGAWFLLIRSSDLDELRVLGPEAMSEETRRRAGDYTSIALGSEVLRYTGAGGRDRYLAQRSHHSGLSPDEMLIPLILGGRDEGQA